jgi:D-alanyl-D-alanine carboxypeptidase
MKRRRFALNLLSAIVGAALGAAGVLALGSLSDVDPSDERPPKPVALADPSTHTPVVSGTVLLGWAPGGLPANAEEILESTRGVRHATTVIAGLDWIRSTRAAGGSVVDRPGAGYRIPFETAVVEPSEYARFVSPVDRPLIEALRRDDILLAQSETGIRNGDEGMVIRFDGRSARVAGIVSDEAANGYEGLVRGPVPASWPRADRFVLVKTTGPAARQRVQEKLRTMLAPGQVLRVRAQGETPFLRYGDAVLPQMLIKSAFGEFAARPLPTGSIQIQPNWVKRNVESAHVPVLGEVTCHRALFPQLRTAMREVVAQNLAYAIDPDDFGGCYSPRFIDSNPGGRLSHHSWGIAFDMNVAENAFGSKPDLDRRLVRVMEDAGFTWGGRWLIPDGMHFEWVDWASAR